MDMLLHVGLANCRPGHGALPWVALGRRPALALPDLSWPMPSGSLVLLKLITPPLMTVPIILALRSCRWPSVKPGADFFDEAVDRSYESGTGRGSCTGPIPRPRSTSGRGGACAGHGGSPAAREHEAIAAARDCPWSSVVEKPRFWRSGRAGRPGFFWSLTMAGGSAGCDKLLRARSARVLAPCKHKVRELSDRLGVYASRPRYGPRACADTRPMLVGPLLGDAEAFCCRPDLWGGLSADEQRERRCWPHELVHLRRDWDHWVRRLELTGLALGACTGGIPWPGGRERELREN